jgi:hypothetical protein
MSVVARGIDCADVQTCSSGGGATEGIVLPWLAVMARCYTVAD